ncbi:hypothetical protein JXQ31_12435 [candidate division KSB1 bacterium]|nr:hypothetical protein [candidate division KSB1 bacterium]
MEIFTPSTEQVNLYLNKWDSNKKFVMQESSLKKLFTETYPNNIEMDDVLIKVCSLNDFYNTNIFNPFIVAEHIVNLIIDKRLFEKDLSLVNDIAIVQVNRTKKINFYSFATKYCSHHQPKVYPIYDINVENILIHFKKKDNFSQFKKNDLKEYTIYHNILIQFRRYYGLDNFTLKELDKYLWQAGKEYFPKQY